MPFVVLATKNVGDPVTATDFNLIKTNFDDHESRLSLVETAAGNIEVFNAVIHNAAAFTTLTGFIFWKAKYSFTLTTAEVGIFTKGALTGTLEIDIKKSNSRDFTAAPSIFTTKPSITYASASDYDDSTNAVFDNTLKNMTNGQWLRFDITQMPTGGTLSKLSIVLKGEI